MDSIKEAFSKVKEDISSLKYELDLLKMGLDEVNRSIFELRDALLDMKAVSSEPMPSSKLPTQPVLIPTHNFPVPTDNLPFKPVKPQIMPFSTGNEGVPTDKQTNQQTNQQTHSEPKNSFLGSDNSIENAANILNSLDALKKEIRLKFKKLTDGELLVFSTLYQLDEQEGYTDYRALSQKLNLTESSIRDYIGRLVSKGIPIEKMKVNNKNIQLKISQNLRKVASLQTILQLREL